MATEDPVFADLVVTIGKDQLLDLTFQDEFGQFARGTFNPAWIKSQSLFLDSYRDRVKNPSAELKRFGQELFGELLGRDEIGQCWKSMRDRSDGRPVHLTINFDSHSHALAAVPLELLLDTGRHGGYLFDHPGSVIVRSVLGLKSIAWSPPIDVPRILIAWARPPLSGVVFDGDLALTKLEELRPKIAEVEVLPRVTRMQLESRLERGAVDYLVILAHGWTHESEIGICVGDTVLERMNADDLARLMRKSGVRLVFLCSCHTAQITSDPAAGIFSGIAQRVLVEVPFVVAMQAKLPVEGSDRLISSFFRELIGGAVPPVAMAKARGVYREKWTWSVPVVYVRPHNSVVPTAPVANGTVGPYPGGLPPVSVVGPSETDIITSPTPTRKPPGPVVPSGSDVISNYKPQSFEPNQPFGEELVLIEKIGQGSQGQVWRAAHKILKRDCVLKIIDPGFSIRGEVRERLKREAGILSKLNHEHIVKIYDARFPERGVAYLVMEYLPGKSMEDEIKGGSPFDLERIALILEQLCPALQHAHEAGVIHRDLKPANLMLGPREGSNLDIIKVIDFGIAKIILEVGDSDSANLTLGGRPVGTPYTISPEQLNKGKPSAKSDIYALGAILYRLLTGQYPYTGSSQAVCAQHSNPDVEPLPFSEIDPNLSYPTGIEELVRRCLKKDPNRRPETIIEVSEEFRSLCSRYSGPSVTPSWSPEIDPKSPLPPGGEELVARYLDARLDTIIDLSEKPRGRGRRPMSRRKAVGLVGLLLTIIVLGAFTLLIWMDRGVKTGSPLAGAAPQSPPTRLPGKQEAATSPGRDYILAEILGDLQKNNQVRPSPFRYVSANHIFVESLRNGESPEERDRRLIEQREALTQALRFLTRNTNVNPPVAIDDQKTIFRIDIKELGWSEHPFHLVIEGVGQDKVDPRFNLYDLLLLDYPYAIEDRNSPSAAAFAREFFPVTEQVRPIPFIRSDWLADLCDSAARTRLRSQFELLRRNPAGVEPSNGVIPDVLGRVARSFRDGRLTPDRQAVELDLADRTATPLSPSPIVARESRSGPLGGNDLRESWESKFASLAVDARPGRSVLLPIDGSELEPITAAASEIEVKIDATWVGRGKEELPSLKLRVVNVTKPNVDLFVEIIRVGSNGEINRYHEGVMRLDSVPFDHTLDAESFEETTEDQAIVVFVGRRKFKPGDLIVANDPKYAKPNPPQTSRLVHETGLVTLGQSEDRLITLRKYSQIVPRFSN